MWSTVWCRCIFEFCISPIFFAFTKNPSNFSWPKFSEKRKNEKCIDMMVVCGISFRFFWAVERQKRFRCRIGIRVVAIFVIWPFRFSNIWLSVSVGKVVAKFRIRLPIRLFRIFWKHTTLSLYVLELEAYGGIRCTMSNYQMPSSISSLRWIARLLSRSHFVTDSNP